MRRALGDPPERLLDGEATEFESRLLRAAGERGPAPESAARMAKALGLTAGGLATAVTAKALALESAAVQSTGTGAALTWVSIGVVGLTIVGAVVGTHVWRAGHHASPPVSPAAAAPAPAAPALEPPPPLLVRAAEPSRGPSASSRRSRQPVASSGDLGEEIAFIDAARAAVSASAGARALEILHTYQGKYPSGSFRPEASAIKVEALMKLGREAEARVLAERFVAEHKGSLLARRVADVARLTTP